MSAIVPLIISSIVVLSSVFFVYVTAVGIKLESIERRLKKLEKVTKTQVGCDYK